MNDAFKIVILTLIGCCSSTEVARALPNMTSTEVIDWFARHPTIPSLEPTQQYELGMSDFHAAIALEEGEIFLSVFLNDRGVVEVENIDYRPECYGSLNCVGNVRFEATDRAGGQTLIKMVWGQNVLEDFQTSTLVDSESSFGMQRWYEGNLYNYETWSYTNNTIVHFSVVSKQASLAERIEQYRYCEQNPIECGP
ncbi:MAG: hypothetical protein SVX43_12575 [Cyanobacteriota bacterium]|nr:hypothetical protein [Cyanobacteriota bacterium]